jgi:hypothetical protein
MIDWIELLCTMFVALALAQFVVVYGFTLVRVLCSRSARSELRGSMLRTSGTIAAFCALYSLAGVLVIGALSLILAPITSVLTTGFWFGVLAEVAGIALFAYVNNRIERRRAPTAATVVIKIKTRV